MSGGSSAKRSDSFGRSLLWRFLAMFNSDHGKPEQIIRALSEFFHYLRNLGLDITLMGGFFISGDFSIFFSKRVLFVANFIKSCLPKLSYRKSCI